jgi:hypothetical protein
MNKMKVFQKWGEKILVMEGWNTHFHKLKEFWIYKKSLIDSFSKKENDKDDLSLQLSFNCES